MATAKSVRGLSVYGAAMKRLGKFRIIHPLPSKSGRTRLGFSGKVSEGDSILPASIGKVSEFNSNGRIIVRKDLDKVSESFMSHRTWNDWHGNQHSGIQIRTMKIYPRERELPPSEYLTALKGGDDLMLCSRTLSLKANSEDEIVHVLNLFLELFGGLEVVSDALESAKSLKVKRLNWQILPPGPYPYARARAQLDDFVAALRPSDKPVVEERIGAITHHNPDFMAVGMGGFSDYVVFGFAKRNIYILESPMFGNATYVFNDDWLSLSALTKKQILDGSLHQARLIHNHAWRREIRGLLKT